MPDSLIYCHDEISSIAASKYHAPLFIDAFSGCGGLSLGLFRAGWQGLFAIEKDQLAFETLKANFLSPESRHTYCWPDWLAKQSWDVEALMGVHRPRLEALRGRVDLLAGGPPCQGFSSAGRRLPSDPRNQLVSRYLELVDLIEPKVVLMENVRGITYDFKANKSNEQDHHENYAEFIRSKLKDKYYVFSKTLRLSNYGVPQERPRFFMIAFRKGVFVKSSLHSPFAALRKARDSFLTSKGLPLRTSAKSAISDLEMLRNGTIPCPDCKGYQAIKYIGPRTRYQRVMQEGFSGTLSDTRLAKHSELISNRFADIISYCKREGRLKTQLTNRAREQFGTKKKAIRVLDPGQPAPTITSMPEDLIHYSEPRTLTVRENARLQTFPDWFVFKGKYTTGGHRRRHEVPRFTQVANAVPPLIAEMFGTIILRYFPTGEIKGSPSQHTKPLEPISGPLSAR